MLEHIEVPFDASALSLGGHFAVLLFPDYVVKIPRSKGKEDLMEFIAEAHMRLSEVIDGILPCQAREGFLIMPRAKGIRASDLSHPQRLEMEKRIAEMKSKASELGYELSDIKLRDSFYDEERDLLTIVDLSSTRRAKKHRKSR